MRKLTGGRGPRSVGGLLAALLVLAGLVWAAGEMMSVQVRTGQLRSRPSFLGSRIAEVDYGTRVTVLARRGSWVEVQDPDGRQGWLHESALSEKSLTMSSGDVEAASGASGDEIALAGKGFNEQVEKEYRKQNTKLDYTWVDRMETVVVTAEEAQKFLSEGGIEPAEGGR